MSWMAQQAREPTPHDSGEESDEYDQLDRPPPQFIRDARALQPKQLQSHFFAAWDKSHGIGEPRQRDSYDPNGLREQAALDFLFRLPDKPPVKYDLDPGVRDPSSSPEISFDKIVPAKPVASGSKPKVGKKRSIINVESSSEGEIEIVGKEKWKAQDQNPPKRRKGKGRQPASSEILLLSDDEDSEPVVVQRRSPKGKKKVVYSEDDNEIMFDDEARKIADNSFDDLMPARRRKAPSSTPLDDLQPVPLPRDSPISAFDAAVSSIVAIIPDVLPSHVLSLLQSHLYAGKVDVVLEHLFEGNYPKLSSVASSSKDKQKEVEKVVEKEVDYLDVKSRKHMGIDYVDAALDVLWDTFSTIPKPYIRSVFAATPCFAPAHARLTQESALTTKPYRTLSSMRAVGKGKVGMCEALEEERAWLRRKLAAERAEKEKIAAKERKQKAEADAGMLIACGCCYTDFCFDDLVQCADAHLFCKECAVGNADTIIGQRNFVLPCMSGEDCCFAESEYKRFLPETSIAALHKIRMEKEVDLADFADLAKCPFCIYACVIENAQERLFRCMRAGCEVVSCRECKKVDHLPKTCLEVSEDVVIDNRHAVEEAMTAALMKACPKCSNPYVKESGCNKMSCPNCRTMSCFVCGQIVTGYEHFANAGTNATYTIPGASCPLWDRPGEREHLAVEAARLAAAKQVGADADDLKLAAPAPPPANLAHLPRMVMQDFVAPLGPEAMERMIAARDAALAEGAQRMAAHRLQARLNEVRRHQEMEERAAERRVENAAAMRKAAKARLAADDAREAKRKTLTGRG